jgi:hypothetical protein
MSVTHGVCTMRAETGSGTIARMPPLTPALALVALQMQVNREAFGPKECEARGIGAVRRRVGQLPNMGIAATATGEVRDQCRMLLAQLCRECPHSRCPMKAWSITAPLS